MTYATDNIIAKPGMDLTNDHPAKQNAVPAMKAVKWT